jgi:hypothetical protein
MILLIRRFRFEKYSLVKVVLLASLVSWSAANMSPNLSRPYLEGPRQVSKERSFSSYESEESIAASHDVGNAVSSPRLRFARMAWGIDKAYVTAVYIGAPHFRRGGWGFNPMDATDPILCDLRGRVAALKARVEPPPINVVWDGGDAAPRLHDGVLVRDGTFLSPGAASLPPAGHTAHFRAVWPKDGATGCPMLVLLPPNGDEDYERRFRSLARFAFRRLRFSSRSCIVSCVVSVI